MSIDAISTTIASYAPAPHRPKSSGSMTMPEPVPQKDPTATGKQDPAPARKDFTTALQAMLLQAQETAGR